jgi:hypothetical protein
MPEDERCVPIVMVSFTVSNRQFRKPLTSRDHWHPMLFPQHGRTLPSTYRVKCFSLSKEGGSVSKWHPNVGASPSNNLLTLSPSYSSFSVCSTYSLKSPRPRPKALWSSTLCQYPPDQQLSNHWEIVLLFPVMVVMCKLTDDLAVQLQISCILQARFHAQSLAVCCVVGANERVAKLGQVLAHHDACMS